MKAKMVMKATKGVSLKTKVMRVSRSVVIQDIAMPNRFNISNDSNTGNITNNSNSHINHNKRHSKECRLLGRHHTTYPRMIHMSRV